MKHFEKSILVAEGQNAFAFWRREHHGKLIIQRKRLPNNAPKEIKELRDLWAKGGRPSMVKYFRLNLPEYLSLREAIDLADEILQGNWRRFGGKVI